MGWYPRSLAALRTFFTSKTAPPKPISTINLLNNPRPSSLFSPAPSTKVVCSNFQPKKHHLYYTPWKWTTISTRSYYVDHNQIRHFKRRVYATHPAFVFIILALGSGISIALIYLGNSETIPYTNRKHFIIFSKQAEIRLAEAQFGKFKEALRGRILPAQHPDSVRIGSIAKAIIMAVERGLRKDKSWTDLSYDLSEAFIKENVEQDEIVDDDDEEDDKWIEQSRKKGKEKGARCATGHLDWLKWEVIIVDMPIVSAQCLAGGKIIVFTGLLEHFKTEAELATVIAHEVGHAVARHTAEQITKNLWYRIAELLLNPLLTPAGAKKMSNYVLRLPFSRRMELEADYIGLLLMASAGYDPREAPLTFEKLGRISDSMAFENYRSTHPSPEKRARMLNKAKVMKEALDIYREAMAGREVEGFFL